MDIWYLLLGSGIEQYEQQATELLQAHRSGPTEVLLEIRNHHPRFANLSESEIRNATFTLDDAQLTVARGYDLESWPTLADWAAAVTRKGSPVWQFEWAVEAVISGDVATLARFLRENPELVRARSMRRHRATLLIYVGANGVEGYRQKTPPNAVQVAETLLEAGAEIDAVGDMYGGTTTLGLVATSVHPVFTGVQAELMEVLLHHGASIERAVASDYRRGLVVDACLANGRPGAAEFLAQRGARLELEGAAGVGRLDVVENFFNEAGSLRPNATAEQMQSAFNWACGYGRTSVVSFLLTKDIDVGEGHRGETGLHHAAYGGHADIVRLLLARGAAVDVEDETYAATPLGWALHGWAHPSPEGKGARYHEVVTLLVAGGSKVEPQWLDDEKVRKDPQMTAAIGAQRR